MKIDLIEVPVRDIVKGYVNNDEEGVIGYDGLLNIRPKYQREFVYKDLQRNAVVETVRKKFPLNVMYWVKNADGTFEVLDGQQRTISLCEYVTGSYSLNFQYIHSLEKKIQYFHNLEKEEQDQILDYKVMVYFCEGKDDEKLDWFKTINIAGEKLTNQELRNAIYTGTWLTDAKRYFSKTGCPAYAIANEYVRGTPIRQDFLETAISWLSQGNIEPYMAIHQNKPNAMELWLYFQAVINWVKVVFPKYRKEMKGVPFGILYNEFKDIELCSADLEKEITKLMQDDDVTKKSGIYSYVLTRNEKFLNVRAFTKNQIREAYERQEGFCTKCGEHFELNEMEGDHITPWREGGKSISDNCQMLCKHDNRVKSDT